MFLVNKQKIKKTIIKLFKQLNYSKPLQVFIVYAIC